jgi:hypothetical protein
MGLPSAADAATRASLAAHPAVDVVVAVQDVGTSATPFLALSASAVRRADGRPSNWSGWTTGVHTTGVHASGVHTTGVRTTGVTRVSGRTRVRCPRPLQPRCPHRAGS